MAHARRRLPRSVRRLASSEPISDLSHGEAPSGAFVVFWGKDTSRGVFVAGRGSPCEFFGEIIMAGLDFASEPPISDREHAEKASDGAG